MSGPVARGEAPGKLILCGEHAVVYGHPAVAMAVDLRTRVRLYPGVPGAPPCLRSAAADLAHDPRLARALAAVLPPGVQVEIDSELPVGRGMGSSAALAVACVRAAAALRGEALDFAQTHARGFEMERVFHGEPSGVDHAVSAMGGACVYRRRPEGPEIRALRGLPALPMVVLDSGVAGDTGALVAGVRSRRPGIDLALDRIGALSAEVCARLEAGRGDIGPLLDENHELLRQIGVSTPQLDGLVALARAAGAAGAKLAGAGGGGVVLALCPDPAPVLAAAAAAGVPAFLAPLAPPGA